MKEINTLVTDKRHFDNRDELFLLPNLWKLYYQDLDAGSNIDSFFSIKPSSRGVRFLIDNLLKETNPVVIEK